MKKGTGKKIKSKKVCRYCLLAVKKKWQFCPKCGKVLPGLDHSLEELFAKTRPGEWHCPNCLDIKTVIKVRRSLGIITNFCTDCGTQLVYRI